MVSARFIAVLALVGLVSCGARAPETERAELGDFRLGYNIVQARDVERGPFSRAATAAELTGAIEAAVERRLARYDGDGLYHIGVAIAAYVLAQPGLPVIYTPRSVLFLDVNVYDNATGQRLNSEPHRITVFEGMRNATPIIGSGLVRGKDEQLANLAEEGARAIEAWLARNPDWFVPDPASPRVEFDREALDARAQAAISALE
ncbi:hypothetical protein [Palleronia sp. LCG004]|uniref:hypothetical protein n=1 Tax=Palleronia sp. LCG004 TaxID=3079304 RepID=UPI002942CDB2|nr:hypothetical protein [Palleronia sp. LCG004]WOI56670.1 hypothetical protein RVY76_02390 [Palleronia sp. LCG004]